MKTPAIILVVLLSLLSCKKEEVKTLPTNRTFTQAKTDKKEEYKNADSIRIVLTDIHYMDSIPEKLPLSFRLRIYKGNKLIQSFSYTYKWEDAIYPDNDINCTLKYCDVDFDGNKDILIYLGKYGNQGVEYYDCFLWNSHDERYIHFEDFKDIENPIPSPADKFIYSSARTSAAQYEYSKYKIQGRKLYKRYSLMVTYNSQRKATYTEKKFDDKGKVIKEQELPEASAREYWNFVLK